LKIDNDIIKKHRKGVRILSNTTQINHRALVIQSTCDLESDLCDRLAAFFVSRNSNLVESKVKDDIYGEGGMFSSLSKMAKIAYYLGLISKEHQHDLLKLTKLRNRYGHDKSRKQLDEEPSLNKLIQDTNLFRQNKSELENLKPQAVYLAIKDQLIKEIQKIEDFS